MIPSSSNFLCYTVSAAIVGLLYYPKRAYKLSFILYKMKEKIDNAHWKIFLENSSLQSYSRIYFNLIIFQYKYSKKHHADQIHRIHTAPKFFFLHFWHSILYHQRVPLVHVCCFFVASFSKEVIIQSASHTSKQRTTFPADESGSKHVNNRALVRVPFKCVLRAWAEIKTRDCASRERTATKISLRSSSDSGPDSHHLSSTCLDRRARAPAANGAKPEVETHKTTYSCSPSFSPRWQPRLTRTASIPTILNWQR